MQTIHYNAEGYIYGKHPFYKNVNKDYYLEVDDATYRKLSSVPEYYCWKVINGIPQQVIYEQERYNAEASRQQMQAELNELTKWFENYDMQVKQYLRCIRLGLYYDCKYGSMTDLDAEAIQKAQRINEIKSILNI